MYLIIKPTDACIWLQRNSIINIWIGMYKHIWFEYFDIKFDIRTPPLWYLE